LGTKSPDTVRHLRPTSLSQCQLLSLRLPHYGRRMKGRGSWLDSMQAQP